MKLLYYCQSNGKLENDVTFVSSSRDISEYFAFNAMNSYNNYS